MVLHTSFKRGKRIHIIKKNGDKLVTKFIERRSKAIITDAGKINNEEIASATILR